MHLSRSTVIWYMSWHVTQYALPVVDRFSSSYEQLAINSMHFSLLEASWNPLSQVPEHIETILVDKT